MIEAAALAAGSLKQVRQAEAITDTPENPSEAWPPRLSTGPRYPDDTEWAPQADEFLPPYPEADK